MQETWVQSVGRDYPLEKEMATHSNILAWEICSPPGSSVLQYLPEFAQIHVH